jgi:hypothetical protein
MNYKSADNSTEQNISWESNTHPASEEISRLLYTTQRSIIVFTAAGTGPYPELDDSSSTHHTHYLF